MSKSSNKFIVIGVLILISVLFVSVLFYAPLKRRVTNIISVRSTTNECPRCAEFFPDVVAVQERAYVSGKMKPVETLDQLDDLYQRGKLSKITSNSKYIVEKMEYARPFVLPEVVVFLEELASEYETNIREKKIEYHPFVLTSATRSIQSAKALKDVNDIARGRSHHLFGKTIDISYKQFGGYEAQQICFIDALRKMRKGKRCYIKFETKGALHTTIR
jgi:hypothetical protein